jgi:2-polyprenyl-3-methyl-5-hydroxy-6-metoxy-1,4-benzoquinol methylase
MTPVPLKDPSNGYEAAAAQFMSARGHSDVGVAAVRTWAKALPSGAAVLDLGCGHGVPISQALVDAGVGLYGIDASPSMIAAFRRRFPNVPAECNAVEDSDFFGRTFDGVVAWGLMFLLEPKVQTSLIHKIAAALKPGGQFLFTSPQRICEWSDIITDKKSVSLGRDGYQAALRAANLVLTGEADDDGENHYYFVRKADCDRRAV